MNLNLSSKKVWEEFSARLKSFIRGRVRSEQGAEDILQDAFIKIHNNIERLREREKLASWIYQITRNAIIDYYRVRKNTDVLEEFPEELSDQSKDTNLNDELASCLKPMINNLPKEYKEAVISIEIDRLKQTEFAKKLNLSQSGAKSRVQRGRARLKEMLLECCHFELDKFGNVLNYRPKSKECHCCPQK